MPDAALSHLNVLDLSHYVAGPHCTKMMAGFGATVVKVERPGTGDRLRSMGPFYKETPDLEGSIPFLWLNTGKKSVTLNLKSEGGKKILQDLARKADVVVESFSPRVMPGLGLSYDVLRKINPGIVMTSISSFGQTGPYRDFRAAEIVEYALSGLAYLTGDPDKAPLGAGPCMAQYTAGLSAYIATLMALFGRGEAGEGQHVDVSVQESNLDNIEVVLTEYMRTGKIPKRTGDEHVLVPWQIYPCQDGYAAIMGGPVRHWLRAVDLFEEPRLKDKPYQRIENRIEHREEVKQMLSPWVARHAKRDIYRAGQARKLAFGYLATLGEVLESPQHVARGYFQEVEHPVTGRQKYCGPPFRPAQTPWCAGRAPLLGEHNEEIYGGWLGLPEAETRRLKDEGVI